MLGVVEAKLSPVVAAVEGVVAAVEGVVGVWPLVVMVEVTAGI